MCTALGGCNIGDYWTTVHDRDDADIDEDSRDPTHLPLDDAGWAVRVLSMAVEPAVHAVVEGMLICLSPELCTSHCDVCNEWVGLGNSTEEAVLREVELRLHKSTKNASRSVLDCLGSFECLSEVATEVAETLGEARELPATVRLEQVAKANYDLLEGARVEAQQNASWQVRRPARFELLRAHIAVVQAHNQTPIGEAEGEQEAGRRLSEAPLPPPLTGMQELMRTATNRTCYQLAIKNSTGAHEAHIHATQLWMHLGGGGNDARGQGRICVDCQFPNYTTSCRGHFAMVGRALIKQRLQDERAPETNYKDRKRRMTEHARTHLNKICCAMRDGVEECHEKYCVMHVRRNAIQRVTHVARQMSAQDHPSAAEHFGVATNLGIDILNPSLHPDAECRDSTNATDNKLECMGRSILHHLSARHGLSYESTKEKLDEYGVNIGESLAAMAKMGGKVRAARGQVKSAFFEAQGRDNARAETLMRESRRRTEATKGGTIAGAGRRLGEQRESFGGHGLGQHALHAGSMRRQLQNASAVMHAGMMAVDRAAIAANNRHLRERRQAGQRYQARPDELDWHTLTHGVSSPLTTILTISAEEGSYASRFGGAVVALNALRDRTSHAMRTAHRRLATRTDPRRKLSPNQAHADKLYRALEESQSARRLSEVGAGSGASAVASPQILELPESHALSWIHEIVDWDHTITEGSRLYEIARRRLKMREGGATHADIVGEHPTGYSLLDDAERSQPSIFGDAVRRLLYRKETNADPPWHAPHVMHRIDRRMSETEGGGTGHGSHIRRLGVAFFESTIAAPFAFWDTLMPSGGTVKGSEVSFWEASLRYIVSSTVGCYFVAPAKETSATQGGEGAAGGDTMYVLRPSSEKLCFPAFPFSLPQIPSFRAATRTEGVDTYALNYHDYCTGDNSAVQQTADVIDALGIDPRSRNPLLPNAAILRAAEAVDSITNAASSGSSEVPNSMNAGRVLCSIDRNATLTLLRTLSLLRDT